jgi:nucleotide-binding universal stress UspA family protein
MIRAPAREEREMKSARRSSVHFDQPIVVGVDANPLADHVVRMGEELGKALSVPVHRVHAVPELPDVWPGLDPARGEALTLELLDSVRKAVEDRVGPIVAGFAARAPESADGASSRKGTGARLKESLVEVVQGHPAEVLLAQARSRKAGLIVLGTHEKRHLLDFGNTLRAVYAKSTIPVWVQTGAAAPIRRILAAIDLSEDSLHALGAARVLAKAFGAEIHAVHCFALSAVALGAQIDSSWTVLDYPYEKAIEADRESFDMAMKEFDWQGVRHRTEIVQASPVEALLERSKTADLVVLGTHGRTGLASVVLGGVAYAVLKRSTRPTLAVPRADRAFRI